MGLLLRRCLWSKNGAASPLRFQGLAGARRPPACFRVTQRFFLWRNPDLCLTRGRFYWRRGAADTVNNDSTNVPDVTVGSVPVGGRKGRGRKRRPGESGERLPRP